MMKFQPRVSVAVFLVCLSTVLAAFQSNGSQFFGGDDSGYYAENPNEKAEFYWSRLRYTTRAGSGGGYGYSYGGFGRGGGSWSRDYPKADRQFLMALRRLTRIEARSTEQVVDLDTVDPRTGVPLIYNYPW